MRAPLSIPKLSLVTGTLDRPKAFARLVESIEEHTTVDWELVVSDASAETVTSTSSRVRILPEKPRLGCTRGYNRAFRAAAGQWVIYLNDDCTVTPRYDTMAISFMEAHPAIGLGALHYSEKGGPFHINSAWGVPYANFGIISRSFGNDIGWMDEGLTMYGNDNSLTFRTLLRDKGIADIPGSRILHHSEQDQVRADNQQLRMKDSRMLQDTYMPLRRYWLAAYRRHRVETSAAPWPHGIPPQEYGAAAR